MVSFLDRVHSVEGSRLGNAIEDFLYLDVISPALGYRRFVKYSATNPAIVEEQTKYSTSLLSTLRKIVLFLAQITLYCTVVPLALCVILKAVYRSKNDFKVVAKNIPLSPPPKQVNSVDVSRDVSNKVSLFDQVIDPHNNSRLIDRLNHVVENFLPVLNARRFIKLSGKIFENKSKNIKFPSILKIAGYATLVLPALAITFRTIYRFNTDFQFFEENMESLKKETRKIREDKTYIPSSKHSLCSKISTQIIKKMPESLRREIGIQNESEDWSDLTMERTLNPDEQRLEQAIMNRGFTVEAHGVEWNKGGITNLLNIMVEGLIQSQWIGGLNTASPALSAGCHGPYYVILDEKRAHNFRSQNEMQDETGHLAYLVPSEPFRKFLIGALHKSVTLGVLKPQECEAIIKKIMIYREFVNLPASATRSSDPIKRFLQPESYPVYKWYNPKTW